MIPQTPRTVAHLADWCCTYQNGNIVPQSPPTRFSIGVYQLSQGLDWKIESPVKWQSYCAAAMHFMMTGIGFHIHIDADFPELLSEINAKFEGWERMMYRLGKAQQMICYSHYISSQSARKSRFDERELRIRLFRLVEQCFALVPPEAREQCCFDEMHILTGDIKLKP